MRILILHSRYLSGSTSGENRVVEDEAKLLAEAGHDVRVWAPSPQVSGVVSGLRLGASAVWSRSAARRVEEMIREHRAEVVHVHNLFPLLSPSVLRSSRAAGAAVVVTLHNYRFLCLPASFLRAGTVCERCLGRFPWPGVAHRCYRGSALGSAALAASLSLHRTVRSFDTVSLFLPVSEFVRRKYVEGGFPEGRLVVKPNFTWPLEPRAGAGSYFLYLGRLSPEKGVDTLLRAWRLGRREHDLVVVGDGPEAPALRGGSVSGVQFRAGVPASEVPRLLAGARAVLVPSRWYEAAPRVIVEAFAAGVPVIASRIGALPDLVRDEEAGILVPPDDPQAWARATARLEDDAECRRLGEGARAIWSQRHSPEQGLRGLEAAYERARSVAPGNLGGAGE